MVAFLAGGSLNIVLSILAFLFGIVVLGVFGLLMFDVVIESLRRLRNDIAYADKKRGRAEIASELSNIAYWFSEDPKTMKLIKDIAQDIYAKDFIEVQDLRDKWRKYE